MTPPVAPSDGTVTASVVNGVGTVTFGHPKGNSLPGALLRAIAAAIADTARRADVRVVALRSTGAGPFCAGASFDELIAIRDEREGKEFFLGFARIILAMIRAPQPVVTRVQGKAAGGGIGIIAASDYAIASDAAQLRLSELAVGIGPFVVGPAIERRVGPGAFGAMALDVEWRDAAWGRAHDLYAQVHPDTAALDAAFDAFVAKLAAANPEATARLKAACWEGTEHWDALLDARAAMSGKLVLGEYTRRAIAEFQKRG